MMRNKKKEKSIKRRIPKEDKEERLFSEFDEDRINEFGDIRRKSFWDRW